MQALSLGERSLSAPQRLVNSRGQQRTQLISAHANQQSNSILGCSRPVLEAQPTPSTSSSSCEQQQRSAGQNAATTRRGALAGLAAVAASPIRPARAFSYEDDDEDFYTKWPYAQPYDILPYIYKNAREGDPRSVLRAIEEFSLRYPMYVTGPEKGAIIEAIVRNTKPRLAIELGTFIGYGAMRIARRLPPGGQLVCVEASQDAADTAREVIKYAGLWDWKSSGKPRVRIENGLSRDVIPQLVGRYGANAQLVFEDHCKDCYLPDLLLMEQYGLVTAGTWVVADNVVYPGAPGFLEYLREPENGYVSELIPARYEYDQVWNPKWKPKADALGVALRAVPTVPHVPPQPPAAQPGAEGGVLPEGAVASVEPVALAPPPPAEPPEPEQVQLWMRDAATELREVCGVLPNGKRCAPIPPGVLRFERD